MFKIDKLIKKLEKAGVNIRVDDGRKDIRPNALMCNVSVVSLDNRCELGSSYFVVGENGVLSCELHKPNAKRIRELV